jgi:hypothetical protein
MGNKGKQYKHGNKTTPAEAHTTQKSKAENRRKNSPGPTKPPYI